MKIDFWHSLACPEITQCGALSPVNWSFKLMNDWCDIQDFFERSYLVPFWTILAPFYINIFNLFNSISNELWPWQLWPAWIRLNCHRRCIELGIQYATFPDHSLLPFSPARITSHSIGLSKGKPCRFLIPELVHELRNQPMTSGLYPCIPYIHSTLDAAAGTDAASVFILAPFLPHPSGYIVTKRLFCSMASYWSTSRENPHRQGDWLIVG